MASLINTKLEQAISADQMILFSHSNMQYRIDLDEKSSKLTDYLWPHLTQAIFTLDVRLSEAELSW
jgi:hypothetical protein